MDPQDHMLIKLFFQILQALHHISSLKIQKNGDKPTKGFERHILQMEKFLRPAQPNTQLFENLNKTHMTWAQNVASVMTDHYTAKISEIQGRISAHSLSALNIKQFSKSGIEWARQKYGKKLRDSEVAEFYRIINALEKKNFQTPIKPNQNQFLKTPVKSSVFQIPSKPRKKSPTKPALSPINGSNAFSPLAVPLDSPKRKHAFSPPATPTKRPRNKSIVKPGLPRPNLSFAQALKSPSTFLKNQHSSLNKNQWQLPKIIKSTLVLGASNLARITRCSQDIQIESFSGAKISHLIKIIQTYKHQGFADRIIFNIGTNDKSCSNIHELTSNLSNLIRTTKQLFPRTRIAFACVTISDALKKFHPGEANTLKHLNKQLSTFRKQGIKILDCEINEELKFASDGIHWLPSTANQLMDHWLSHFKIF